MSLRGVVAAMVPLAVAVPPSAKKASPVSDRSGAEAPPTAPLLRVETRGYTTVINSLSTDRDETLVATASDDKTVRLWDAASGQLLDIFRIPIGEGAEGMLYAVALSPDDKRMVASGYTGISWDGTFSLYLFDVEKRRIAARLSSLPALVNHLAYSPDGQVFAAVLSG